jgi:hypothetical protein
MEEKPNPYRAPLVQPELRPPELKKQVAPTAAYSIIGAMLGTALIIPMVLRSDPATKLQGALVFGAPIGGLIGCLLGRRKRRLTHWSSTAAPSPCWIYQPDALIE